MGFFVHDGSMPTTFKPKPLLRGHFHQAAFFFALGACAMLVGQSFDLKSFMALLIYSISLNTMFGVSALYHRPHWQERSRMLMKRLDHAAIFISIAGTGTPICLLALPPDVGLKLLTIIWVASLLGVLKSLFWVHAPKPLGVVLYIGVGWIYGYYLFDFVQVLMPVQMTLLVAGGLVYTVGAVIYAFKRPNPSPQYFGYHEIFHILTIVAATLHFLAVRMLVV